MFAHAFASCTLGCNDDRVFTLPPAQGKLPDNADYPFRPCWVNVRALFPAPGGNYNRRGDEWDTSRDAPGFIARWERGSEGQWIAVVAIDMSSDPTRPPRRWDQQRVAAEHVRPREL